MIEVVFKYDFNQSTTCLYIHFKGLNFKLINIIFQYDGRHINLRFRNRYLYHFFFKYEIVMDLTLKINTIKQLKNSFATHPKNIQEIFNIVNLLPNEYTPYCIWDKDKYQRVVLEKKEDYELVLMCWEKGQETFIHDHDGNQGWIIALHGALEEQLYFNTEEMSPLKLKSVQNMQKGQVSYINDDIGIHRVRNIHSGRSISLHCYNKAITQVNVYDEVSGEKSIYNLH